MRVAPAQLLALRLPMSFRTRPCFPGGRCRKRPLPLEHPGIPSGEREPMSRMRSARVGLTEFANSLPRDLSGDASARRASPGRWSWRRRCCSWTSRSVRSTNSPGSTPCRSRAHLARDALHLPLRHPRPLGGGADRSSGGGAVPRPARIREIIPIDVPVDKRSESHPKITAARDRIWELIRTPSEGAIAERSLDNRATPVPLAPGQTTMRGVPLPRQRLRPHHHAWIGMATLVVVLLLWQAAARLQSDRIVLPSPPRSGRRSSPWRALASWR